jgi:hypothetical protein
MREAPWQANDAASFPTLGSAPAPAKKAPQGLHLHCSCSRRLMYGRRLGTQVASLLTELSFSENHTEQQHPNMNRSLRWGRAEAPERLYGLCPLSSCCH